MYKIIEIQDVSRPRCKRFVAHVIVASSDKNEIKTVISQATEDVKASVKLAHVVRLYIHANEKLICQSMWVDKTFTGAQLPKPLNYNDWNGDIGIVW
jgi:hypothetical protein